MGRSLGRYCSAMGTTPSDAASRSCSPARPDLYLLRPDIPYEERLREFPGLTPAQMFVLNADMMRRTAYDEEYFAKSLARKVTVPFVMH